MGANKKLKTYVIILNHLDEFTHGKSRPEARP